MDNEFILAYKSRLQSMLEEVTAAGAGGSWPLCIYSQQTGMNAGVQLAFS